MTTSRVGKTVWTAEERNMAECFHFFNKKVDINFIKTTLIETGTTKYNKLYNIIKAAVHLFEVIFMLVVVCSLIIDHLIDD